MFLYVADVEKCRISPNRLPKFLAGKIRTVKNKKGCLVWIEDKFTKGLESRGQVRIEIRRPEVDREPLVLLVWKTATDEIHVERCWSGEFAAYVARERTWVLASHLRFVAWLCGGVPSGTQQVKPASRVRILRGELREEHASNEFRVPNNPERFEHRKATE